MASIVLEGVTKRFPDGTEAVKETTFTIEDGEFFILVGPSGCGKSTMLNMIVGLEDLTAGKLRVGDDVVNDVDPKDRNMAMVFQTYAIYPHMTVRENIAFPLRLAKMPQDEIDRRVQEAAEILELSEQLDKKPASLSGGQRQRVAMGRAIVREPVAFLMDEPLSNLDAKLRVQMRTELTRLHQRLETTTVYVTHDQTEAMTLGDRIAVMREGEVQQIGTPRDLYLEPTNLFVAGFIGSPSMNFLPAGRDGDTIELPMVEFTLSDEQRDQLPDEDRRLIAGIRPEHFEDAALVGDAGNGVTFTVTVDVVEWMGNEIFAYFDVEAEVSDELRALAAELENPEMAAGEGIPAVAALDAASDVREQSELELWLDTAQVQLFDAETGQNLTVASARSEQRAGSA